MLLDAHAHLDMYDSHLLGPALADIEKLKIFTISVAMDNESYKRNLDIAAANNSILPIFGIHPWKAPTFIGKLDSFKPLIEQSPMLGEIGLDKRFIRDDSAYSAQRYVFEYFLKAAKAQNKIVNIHTAGAEEEISALLDCYGLNRVIVHWYSGPLDIARRFIDRGMYLTIGVEVLFSEHIQELCEIIPDGLLLTETDNPGGYDWLAKQSGMPRLSLDVVKKIAEIRGTTPQTIEDIVWGNFRDLIKDDPHLNIDFSLSV
jgi:TatD DNase family protein